MAFEQNQQDAFNLRNDTESLKRLEAELDKATTAIGAAEAAAEEELAEQKLKNLVEQQKLRVKQLEQLLALEEDSIQELATLRLTLSNKQFEARKKELQKEARLVEKAIDEQLKIENKKRKKNKQKGSSKKTSQAATKKVSSVTEDIKASSNTKTSGAANKDFGRATSSNTTSSGTKQRVSQAEQSKGRDYTNDSGGMEAVDIGRFSAEKVFSLFDTYKSSMDASAKSLLEKATAYTTDEKGKKTLTSSQATIDLTGELLTSFKQTEAAQRKIDEFNADIELNAKLAYLAQEQEAKNRSLKEYEDHVKRAGKFALDQAEFEAEQRQKLLQETKKGVVSGILAPLREGKFNLADTKKSYTEYLNQRTQAWDKEHSKKFRDSYNRDELKDELRKENPKLSDEDLNKKVEERINKDAEVSAKLTANFELLAEAAGGLAATLDAKVKEISSMQGFVDTRLQGSKVNDRDFGNGSYWNELLEDAKKIAGASPFIKQEKLVDNIKALVDKGISFDIKQRAFLMTIQEKIANTFNAADGTLLRLIRIQQQDTTAGRLGMESALNSFLNSMYETSEYLNDVAASVRGSLEEMQALMEGAAGTELEFQVQKWMGSLYSVGMSDRAVQDIAQTFGQIASGDVGGLTGSGTGNLLIMAANEAGISIADILQEGLDADETNKLMQAMVNYLAEIAETSSDSRVVQQQLANVYGIKASDLRAATNLATSLNDVSKQDLSYSGMLGQLESMMNTIRFRTSIGEGMTNMWDNMMYSMASTQASNPILYALPKMADLLRDVTGGDGIALPFVNVMGFGVDLNTSVADLMSVASMAGTALGSLGPVLTGLQDLVNPLVGSTMLLRAGIFDSGGRPPVLARGSAQPLQHLGGTGISVSGYIGNASPSDVKNVTLQEAEDSKKKQLVEAKDEESSDDVVIKAQQAAVDIYNLLEEVAHGSQSLRVRVVNSNAGGGILGSTSGAGTTGAVSGDGGADNGNWVLSF